LQQMSVNRVRPEHSGPPELYYNESEACKYASNSHIVAIQAEMAERALELLALPEEKSAFLLDIGCGTGISGGVLANSGHCWVGLDISKPMLDIASQDDEDRGSVGDLIWADMGSGVPFMPGTFDGAIRVYLVLMTGGIAQLPKALTGEEQGMDTQRHVENTARAFTVVRKNEKKPLKGSKEWIQKKRERMLKQGR
uniref:Methyltransf_25 domain-containing protein n=1 Tax=Heligmosomoides polygyrus TaxID=6339 RepID=A0A183GEF5_HELPZ